jgi:exopolysaccharide production protein ExoZ
MSVTHKPGGSGAYGTLDAWRGLASLWVALYHAALVIVAGQPALRSEPLYVFSLVGWLGVPMFFVISGYCIAHSACRSCGQQGGLGRFLQARLRRIYPPCWFALALAALLSVFASLLVASGHLASSVMAEKGALNQDALYYVANLALLQPLLRRPFLLPQCWTLCYEIAFYGIVGLVLPLAARLRGKQVPALLGVLNGLTGAVLLLLILRPAWRLYPLDLWPQFGLGVAVYAVLEFPAERAPKVWAAINGALCLALVISRDYHVGLMGSPGRVTFAFSLAFALAILLLRRYDAGLGRLRPVRALSLVGLFSYSLYLTHYFSIGVISQATKIFRPGAGFHYLSFFTMIGGAVVFGWIFFHWFERPFLKTRAGRRVAGTAAPLTGAASPGRQGAG